VSRLPDYEFEHRHIDLRWRSFTLKYAVDNRRSATLNVPARRLAAT
jgi:hypothetical protein